MISWRSITGFVVRQGEELWQVIAIVLATLLSFLIALWLNLAEPSWSVITAAIVARFTAQGALRPAIFRLLGTLIGAFIGLVVALGRGLIAEPVLLFFLVATLASLGVVRRELRAALIAGIIVFSAAAHVGSPFAPALARIVEVGLGATVAALVSIILGAIFRPSQSSRRRNYPQGRGRRGGQGGAAQDKTGDN
jgi:p-hydroxybenzoic acid efflux pump subunit AaeB